MCFLKFIFLFSHVEIVEILFTNESHASKMVLEEKDKKLQIVFGKISGSGVAGMPKSKVCSRCTDWGVLIQSLH